MNAPIEREYSAQDITSRKTAICAVAIGEAIIQELVGKEISNIPAADRETLMSTVINNSILQPARTAV